MLREKSEALRCRSNVGSSLRWPFVAQEMTAHPHIAGPDPAHETTATSELLPVCQGHRAKDKKYEVPAVIF